MHQAIVPVSLLLVWFGVLLVAALPVSDYDDSLMDGARSCPCPNNTAYLMKGWRQCRMRRQRNNSEYANLTHQQFLELLEGAPSHCSIGDMCKGTNEAYALQQDCLSTESGQRRRGGGLQRDIFTGNPKWPLSITYSLSTEYTANEKQKIREAFAEYTAKTCLTFQELNYQTTEDLTVQNGDGCSSYQGMYNPPRQQISLAAGTHCFAHGTILHEIGHALGMIHEHSRSDRNSAITVLYNNIKPGVDRGNFERLSASQNILMGEYDYSSMMQYGAGAGAVADKLVLVPTDIRYLTTMGQRGGLAFLDLLSVNKRYCNDECSSSSTVCQRNGYPDPTDCSRCLCQPFFSGANCQDLLPQTNAGRCVRGAEIMVTRGNPQTLTIYDYPNQDLKCVWRIKAPAQHRISVATISNKYLIGRSPICQFHWLEFRDGTSPAQAKLGLRFCGDDKPTGLPEVQELLLMFDVNRYDRWPEPTYDGFSLQFTAVAACIPNPVANSNGGVVSGNGVTYTCNPGYLTPSNETSFIATCTLNNGNAVWTNVLTCDPAACTPNTPVANSDGGVVSGDNVIYTCNPGYRTPDNDTSFTAMCTIDSNGNAVWTNVLTCVTVACISNPNVANSNGGVVSGNGVTYTCNTGYRTPGNDASFVAMCTVDVNGTAIWSNLLTCVDIDECTSRTPYPCSVAGSCLNTPGSFMCRCASSQNSDKEIRLSAVFSDDYSSSYGSLTAARQAEFTQSAEQVFMNKYQGTGQSITSVKVCSVREVSSFAVDHLVVFPNSMTDIEKSAFAYKAKMSLDPSSTLTINGQTLTLKQGLGFNTGSTQIFPITSGCSYLNQVNPCQHGGSCQVVSGNPTCSCPPTISGTYCENITLPIVLGVVGAILLIVIIIVVCYCCFSERTKKAPKPKNQRNMRRPGNYYAQGSPKKLTPIPQYRQNFQEAPPPFYSEYGPNQQRNYAPMQRRPGYANYPPGYYNNNRYISPEYYPSPQRLDATAFYNDYYQSHYNMGNNNNRVFRPR